MDKSRKQLKADADWTSRYSLNTFEQVTTKDVRCTPSIRKLELPLRKYEARRACSKCGYKVKYIHCSKDNQELCLLCTALAYQQESGQSPEATEEEIK